MAEPAKESKAKVDDFITSLLMFVILPILPVVIAKLALDQLSDHEIYQFVALFLLSAGLGSRYRSLLIAGVVGCFFFYSVFVVAKATGKQFPFAWWASVGAFAAATLSIIIDRANSHLVRGERIFQFEK